MRILTFAFFCALALPLSAHAQSHTVWRPVDPTKPRDGFGWIYETRHEVTGGVTVSTSYPTIVALTDSMPAKAAGLEVGDEILSADGKDLVRNPIPLNPPAGTRMVLRVKHKDQIREVTLVSVRLYTPPGMTPLDIVKK